MAFSLRDFMKTTAIVAAASLVASVANAQATSPITSVGDIINLANNILFWMSTIFWIAGAASIFYAGFLYMFAGGESEKVEKAKKQLYYSVLAIVIGLMAAGASVLINNFLTTGAKP